MPPFYSTAQVEAKLTPSVAWKGLVGDDVESVEWANAYQHYVALHQQLESQLRVAA